MRKHGLQWKKPDLLFESPLFSTCDTQQSSLHYQLFSELHDHKLLVNWQDKQWVISQQSPALNLTQMAP